MSIPGIGASSISGPFLTPQSETSRKEVAREKTVEFFPAHRERDKKLLELYVKKIIDENGVFIGELPDTLPSLSDDISTLIDYWVDQIFTIESKNGTFTDGLDNRSINQIKTTMREALAFLLRDYSIFLVGGTARHILQHWFKAVISQLTGSPLEKSPWKEKNVFDFDLRIDMPNVSFNTVLKALDHFLLYFASKLVDDSKNFDIYRAAFRSHGVNGIQDQLLEDVYTMLSVKDVYGNTIDFNFVSKLKRENLFISDAGKVNISDVVRKKGPATIDESDRSLLIQASIDNEHGLVHAINPDSINHHGFFRIIKAITTGDLVWQNGLIEILFVKMLSYKNGGKNNIVDLFQKCYERHIKTEEHPKQKAFLLNAITTLFRYGKDRTLIQEVAHNLLNVVVDNDDSFLSKILRFLKNNPNQYEVLEAWMQLVGLLMLSGSNDRVSLVKHDDSLSLQWHEDSGHWTIPLKPQEAIAKLSQYNGPALNELLDLVSIGENPGYFYECHSHLGCDTFTQGLTHADPAIQRLCLALTTLMSVRNQPEKHSAVCTALKSDSIDSALRDIADLDFNIAISSQIPETKNWDRSGKILFERFIATNPELAVQIFEYNAELLQERDLFCALVKAYQQRAGSNGETLVQCALKLRNPKKKQEKLANITSELLWTASSKNGRADPVSQLKLISQCINENFLVPKHSDETLIECLKDFLVCKRITSEEVCTVWDSAVKSSFFQDKQLRAVYLVFLGSLLSHHGQDQRVIDAIKTLNLTEKEKIELQKTLKDDVFNEALLTQKQKYDKFVGELKLCVKRGEHVLETWKSAHACSNSVVDHNAVVEEAFFDWCKTDVTRAINLFSTSELKNLWTERHAHTLLINLNPNSNHQIRWSILELLLKAKLENEKILNVFEVLSSCMQSGATPSKQIQNTACAWIERHLHLCPKPLQVAVISATHYVGFSGLSNANVIFDALDGVDLELAHHALGSLHHDKRSYTPKQIELLKQLASQGSKERQLLWRRRLVPKYKDQVAQEIPNWVKDLTEKGYITDAFNFLLQHNSSDKSASITLWSNLLIAAAKTDIQKALEIATRLKEQPAIYEDVLINFSTAYCHDKSSKMEPWIKFMTRISPRASSIWLNTFYLIREQWQDKSTQSFGELIQLFLKTKYLNKQIPMPMSSTDIQCLGIAAECLKLNHPLRKTIAKEASNQVKMQGLSELLSDRPDSAKLSVCNILLETEDPTVLAEVYGVLDQSKDETPYFRTLFKKAFHQAARLNASDFNIVYSSLENLFISFEPNLNCINDEEYLSQLSSSIESIPFSRITILFISLLVKNQRRNIDNGIPVPNSIKCCYLRLIESFITSFTPDEDMNLLRGMFDINFVRQFPPNSIETLVIVTGQNLMLIRTSDSKSCLKQIQGAKELLDNLKSHPKFQQAFGEEVLRKLVRHGFFPSNYASLNEYVIRILTSICGNANSAQPAAIQMEAHCCTVSPSCANVLLFKPKDLDKYFHHMSEFIRELCLLDISRFDETQFRFWLSYTGELLKSFISQCSSKKSRIKPEKSKILMELLDLFVYADIPYIPGMFRLHCEWGKKLVNLQGIKDIGQANHDLAQKSVMIFIGSGCDVDDIKDFVKQKCQKNAPINEIVNAIVRISKFTNIERTGFAITLLANLQVFGIFNSYPNEYVRAYQALGPLLAKAPLATFEGVSRDPSILRFLLIDSATDILRNHADSLNQPIWFDSICNVNMLLLEHLHTGHQMLLESDPSYEHSNAYFNILNLLLFLFQQGNDMNDRNLFNNSTGKLLPTLFQGFKSASNHNLLNKQPFSYQEELEFNAFELDKNILINPLCIFFAGNLMTAQDKSIRIEFFKEWMKLIIGWEFGFKYYRDLEIAQNSFGIFPNREEYIYCFTSILNAHIQQVQLKAKAEPTTT